MKSVTAGLIRISALTPAGPFRSLISALVKAAADSKGLDNFARASYLEGVLGYSPGSLTKNPRPHFAAARKALEKGDVDLNPITRKLVGELGMSDRDTYKMVQDANHGVWDALVFGADSVMAGSTGSRGLSGEGVAQAIAGGFSPVTNKKFSKYGGNGVFYWLGTNAPGGVSIAGLKSIARKEAKNRAVDVVRATRDEEKGSVSTDAPKGLSEAGQATFLVDTLQQDSGVSRATYVDLASAIYNDPWVMDLIDREVRSGLRGEVQEAVWTAIKQDPNMLIIKPDSIGVANLALSQVVSKALGRETSPQAVGQNFRKKVLPAVQDALEDSTMAKRLLKRRNILNIIEESTKRRVSPHEKYPIPSAGVEPSGHGEMREWDQLGLERSAPPKSTTPKWLQKMRTDPNLKALRDLGFSRAARLRLIDRVAFRFNERKAWKMSAPQQKMYKKLKDWALGNWEQFQDSSGSIDTDKMAHRLAVIGGNRRMVDDNTHWIWEIVYDVERQSRWR